MAWRNQITFFPSHAPNIFFGCSKSPFVQTCQLYSCPPLIINDKLALVNYLPKTFAKRHDTDLILFNPFHPIVDILTFYILRYNSFTWFNRSMQQIKPTNLRYFQKAFAKRHVIDLITFNPFHHCVNLFHLFFIIIIILIWCNNIAN